MLRSGIREVFRSWFSLVACFAVAVRHRLGPPSICSSSGCHNDSHRAVSGGGRPHTHPWPLSMAWAPRSMALGSREGCQMWSIWIGLRSKPSDLPVWPWTSHSVTFPPFYPLQGHPGCKERGLDPTSWKEECQRTYGHLNSSKVGWLAT